MKFKNWIISEVNTNKIIVYHGTSSENLKSIMSQGLIPNSRKKAWGEDDSTGFYNASRKSLDGVYVTTNLLTALSASKNGKNDRNSDSLIVIIELQPKSGLMDEDDLNKFSFVSNSDHILFNIYSSNFNHPEFEKYLKKFESFFSKLKSVDSKIMDRLHNDIFDLFKKAVVRQISYIGDEYFDRSNIIKPNSKESEMNFLKSKDNLTRKLKMFSNPFNYKEDPFNFKSRVESPIRFSGSNRIISIVSRSKSDRPKVIYGVVPDQFIKDWTAYIGEWNPGMV